jgi:hypothetical protein
LEISRVSTFLKEVIKEKLLNSQLIIDNEWHLSRWTVLSKIETTFEQLVNYKEISLWFKRSAISLNKES